MQILATFSLRTSLQKLVAVARLKTTWTTTNKQFPKQSTLCLFVWAMHCRYYYCCCFISWLWNCSSWQNQAVFLIFKRRIPLSWPPETYYSSNSSYVFTDSLNSHAYTDPKERGGGGGHGKRERERENFLSFLLTFRVPRVVLPLS